MGRSNDSGFCFRVYICLFQVNFSYILIGLQMNEIKYFMIGSIWTLLILMAGVVIGYLMVNFKIRRIVEENKKTAPLETASKEETPQGGTTVVESGAVKAIQKDEVEKERQKGFIGKMEEIIKNVDS